MNAFPLPYLYLFPLNVLFYLTARQRSRPGQQTGSLLLAKVQAQLVGHPTTAGCIANAGEGERKRLSICRIC